MTKKSQVLVEKSKDKKAASVDEKTGVLEVFIMGKSYQVPTGLTIMKAIEYAGYRFIRSCGCRAGFCGACSTVYRLENEQKLGFDNGFSKLVKECSNQLSPEGLKEVAAILQRKISLSRLATEKDTLHAFSNVVA